MKTITWLLGLFIVTGCSMAPPHVINIPKDYATIQAGIQAATDGDTVLVAPGLYQEQIAIKDKAITLGSHFLITADTTYIRKTIIDGGGETVIKVKNTGDAVTAIIGFTIQNGEDGISAYAKLRVLHNHIITCKDGIDYENDSGGICRFNLFENNSDDGVDFDENVDIVLENNIIRNNEDDGIEIRLQPYTGPLLTYIIRRNQIYGNGEDGIQFIDYASHSQRVFFIEDNLIYGNAMVGVACMSDSNTIENYKGAPIPERIYLINNTFVDNNYGVTGGDNLVALNNLIANTTKTAMKNVDGHSIISHCAFWQNGIDAEHSNKDEATIFYHDPFLDKAYKLSDGSPCIDHGVSFFIWRDDTVLNMAKDEYIGSAPDIGAFEFEQIVAGK